jgi:hypothetical protein
MPVQPESAKPGTDHSLTKKSGQLPKNRPQKKAFAAKFLELGADF